MHANKHIVVQTVQLSVHALRSFSVFVFPILFFPIQSTLLFHCSAEISHPSLNTPHYFDATNGFSCLRRGSISQLSLTTSLLPLNQFIPATINAANCVGQMDDNVILSKPFRLMLLQILTVKPTKFGTGLLTLVERLAFSEIKPPPHITLPLTPPSYPTPPPPTPH